VNAEEIAEELCEIFCENADEPAGRNCGYGVTDDGQEQILAVIKRILPQTLTERKCNMSTATVKEQQVFKVTAIEYFEAIGDEAPTTPAVLIWQEARFGTDDKSLIFAVQHELTTKKDYKDPADTAAFFNRLKVSAVLVNFPH